MLKIENLFYCPVKSISFTESITLNIIKDRGIENDRIFAFTQNLDTLQIKNLEQKPHLRKLNNFITLKNSPELNQYNFLLNKDQLILKKSSEEIIKINPYAKDEMVLLLNQISKFIKKEKKINFVIDQKNPFFVNQALTRMETLRGMTIWAAKSNFMETKVGSLEIGKLADFVVLDVDLMNASDKAIRKAKVKRTAMQGVTLFAKDKK